MIDLQKIIKENKSLKGNKSDTDTKKIISNIKKRVISKDIIRNSRHTVNIPEREVESVLNDPNRFFKGELAKEKKAMFFE
jgi:hypothetical protein